MPNSSLTLALGDKTVATFRNFLLVVHVLLQDVLLQVLNIVHFAVVVDKFLVMGTFSLRLGLPLAGKQNH